MWSTEGSLSIYHGLVYYSSIYIKPSCFATMTNATILLPLGYIATAKAVNSAATINQLGLPDCYW